MHNTISWESGDNEVTIAYLMQSIQQIIPKIADQLTASLSWYSPNAQYVPESIKIISIEHREGSRYKMTYSFRWNVFNGCLDLDTDEKTIDTVNFYLRPDAVVFDIVETARPTTADEL
ncbi:hypothetical protein ACQK5W_05060 [Pantoea sp. FN060301]|uniref:hypothetical protein n=1 Tax=Pantoea sp. FN060301 TaxID=3420380 RepID=UPI003D162EC8